MKMNLRSIAALLPVLAASIVAFTPAQAAPPAASKGEKIEVTTGSPKEKDALVFNPSALKVKAGTRVSLTFKNSSSEIGAIHNFVLTRPGRAQSVIDASVLVGADRGWLAESADVLMKTKLVEPGESVTVEFTAPSEAGDYPYVCTFPGCSTMRGVLKVTK